MLLQRMVWRYCLALGLCGLTLQGANWTKAVSPHFEVFTTGGEKRSREIVKQFEQVREIFLELRPALGQTNLPIRIIGFSSKKEFEPYAINEVSGAYYFGTRDRDYIVMGTVDRDTYRVAVHEYMHLLFRHTGLKLPVWLNEGLADVYSTLRPHRGDQVVIGDVIPWHFAVIQSGRRLPFGDLLSAGHDSPLYNAKQHVGMFYAQSWALVHMLTFGAEYRDKMNALVGQFHRGATPDEAFRVAFGKELAAVSKDFDGYWSRLVFQAAVFEVPVGKSAEQAVVTTPDEFESGLVLADLLALTKKGEGARKAYLDLAARFPGRPEIHEGLADVAMREGRFDEAIGHHAEAAAAGSRNARAFKQWAALLSQAGRPAGEVMAALEKAVAIDPADYEAWEMLGGYAYNLRDYRKAVDCWGKVRNLKSDRAYRFFRNLAFAWDQLGVEKEAISAATRAKQYAQGPEEGAEAAKLLEWVSRDRSRPFRPPALTVDVERPRLERRDRDSSSPAEGPQDEVRTGTLEEVECLGQQARLVIKAGSETVRLLIHDPAQVVVQKEGGGDAEFACGAQPSTPVSVAFQRENDGESGTVGRVTRIEFR